MARDPQRNFLISRLGFEYYQLTPARRQSIRLPKWYTASRLPSGEWYVTNHLGRVLKSGSQLHVKITEACQFQYYGRAVGVE